MRWIVAGRQNRQKEKREQEKEVEVEEGEEKANGGGGRWAWEWTWTPAAGSDSVVVVGLAAGEGPSQWQTDLQETERPADAYQSLSWTGSGTGSADGETQLAGSAVWVVASVEMLAEVLMLEEEVVATSRRRDSRGSGIRGCQVDNSAPGEAGSGSVTGRGLSFSLTEPNVKLRDLHLELLASRVGALILILILAHVEILAPALALA
ncbi:hypothetical protein Neosp_003378 [[Neocosmospora] mangrovei]